MLTARRDPLLHPGAPDTAHAAHPGHAAHSPGFTRFMNFLQVAGSLLAIPLGLASGYSIYHANFSAEASCQSLRTNIISMLDKSADASTLRMLMRRDVADFETACGAVDPDAVKAFKTLLASGKNAVPAPEPVKQAAPAPVRHVKEMAKRAPAKAPPAVEAKPARRDSAASDAKWVASVREALIHTPDAETETAKAPAVLPAQPPVAARPVTPPAAAPRATPAAPVSLAPPTAARTEQAAPALPPAASVAAAPKPAPDHPVPPAAIPDAAPPPPAAAPAAKQSHPIRDAIAEIPLLGRMVGK